jgi:fatty acid desaturase
LQKDSLLSNFRELRIKLVNDGWFKRSLFWECFYSLSVYLPIILSVYLSIYANHTLIPILLIGFSMQQAGWIAHDYIHGRGTANFIQGRLMGSLVNGFSATWWSNKHNTHHVYTNYMGVDKDIDNEPIFWLCKIVFKIQFRVYTL